MTDQAAAIYQYIVRELAPHEAGAGEAPITIVCEPLSDKESPGLGGALSMRLNPGTTPDEAREIASLLQRKVKRFCHLEPSR